MVLAHCTVSLPLAHVACSLSSSSPVQYFFHAAYPFWITLKMEASSSKTLVPIYQYILCYSYPMIYVKIMCQYSLLQKKVPLLIP